MAIDLNSMTTDELRDQAAKNSQKWHTADSTAEQDALHNENVEINRIIDARTGSTSTYDAPSGTWTVTGGSDYPVQLERQLARQANSTGQMLAEYRNLYSAQSAQNAYQQMLAQQQAAQAAAVQKAVNALENQKTSTDAEYSDLFRQLYINKMNNRKNLDQQLAAGGVTGGAAETTRLSYDTAYEDALRQSEQSRIGALKDLDMAIADARLTGDIESANAAASAVREQTSAYADALKYLINRQDAIDARQEAYAREDAQRAAAFAQQLAKEQREAEEAAEKAAKPTLTVAQVNAAIKAGHLTDAVLAAYEYYYGEAYRQ